MYFYVVCILGVHPIVSSDDDNNGDVRVGQLAIEYVVSPKVDEIVEVPVAKRPRRYHVDDGSRWGWVESPPPTQAARASIEHRAFRSSGYDLDEGPPPARVLSRRFISLAEYHESVSMVSRVAYRLPRTHPQYASLAVEVIQRYAPDEVPREHNGMYAVEYPTPNRPYIFENRQQEDACYAAYLASLVAGKC